MAFELFGYEISKRIDRGKKENPPSVKSFADPMETDGSTIISSNSGLGAGYYSHVLDLDAVASNDRDLIYKYRQASSQPECDIAINDI